jgi:hypothetical protein
MKKICIICETEIDEEKDFCKNCLEFIKWKYKKDSRGNLAKFRKVRDYLEEWREQSTEKEVKE